MGSSAPYRVHRKPAASTKKKTMAPQRVLGIILGIGGAAVLVYGLNLSRAGDAPAAGASVHAATWYVMSGLVVTLAGFILAVLGIRRGTPRD